MSSSRPPAALLLALTLGAALSACGQGSGGSAAPPASSSTGGSPSASAAPAIALTGGGTYATPEAILAALRQGGLSCTDPMDGSYPDVAAAKSCVLGGTEDAVLLVFASETERSQYLRTKEPLASAVVGENWAVQTVLQSSAEQVARAVGGTVVPGSG